MNKPGERVMKRDMRAYIQVLDVSRRAKAQEKDKIQKLNESTIEQVLKNQKKAELSCVFETSTLEIVQKKTVFELYRYVYVPETS